MNERNAAPKWNAGFLVEQLCNWAFSMLEIVRRLWGKCRVENITVDELASALADPRPTIILIDVRSAAERFVSRIPGSITLEEYLQRDVLSQGLTVIPYCAIGGRSYLCAARLAEQGVSVKNFRAGIVGWCRAGQRLEAADGSSTNRVHTYWRIFRIPNIHAHCEKPDSIG